MCVCAGSTCSYSCPCSPPMHIHAMHIHKEHVNINTCSRTPPCAPQIIMCTSPLSRWLLTIFAT